MSGFEALLLGVLQGLTEFLPVSSSGHLVLAQASLGLRLPGVAFEVVVHVATLFAVLWAYRRRVDALARGVLGGDRESVRYLLLLALASVPAGLAGFFARDLFEATFESPRAAAGFLVVTGAIVWSLRLTASRARDEVPDAGQAIWAGLAQALAIFPGISRSGATVAAGVWRGVEGVRMAEFSFLMSVPAVGGAALLQSRELGAATVEIGALPLATGFLAALVSGVGAIHLFVRALEADRFHLFGYYCVTVGFGFLGASFLVPELAR